VRATPSIAKLVSTNALWRAAGQKQRVRISAAEIDELHVGGRLGEKALSQAAELGDGVRGEEAVGSLVNSQECRFVAEICETEKRVFRRWIIADNHPRRFSQALFAAGKPIVVSDDPRIEKAVSHLIVLVADF
jgi:hypothetical protein